MEHSTNGTFDNYYAVFDSKCNVLLMKSAHNIAQQPNITID